MTTILLGPQRFTITLETTVRSLGIEGPVAVINSGWEEREGDDEELGGYLQGRGRNLRLFHRLVDTLAKDRYFAAEALSFRDRHDELRAFYGIRLQGAVDTVAAVAHRTSLQSMGPIAEAAAVETVRDVDRWYSAELAAMYAEIFGSSVQSSETIGWHRGEIAALLDECEAVVMPGGNVRALLRTLHLFEVRLPPEKPVIAWSAGAMALTDEVVLFHDFGSSGVTVPEVHDTGLGRLPGLIALPHAKRRLRLDDHARMSLMARRFPDHQLLLLDDGAVVRIDANGVGLPPGSRVLSLDGTVTTVAAA